MCVLGHALAFTYIDPNMLEFFGQNYVTAVEIILREFADNFKGI